MLTVAEEFSIDKSVVICIVLRIIPDILFEVVVFWIDQQMRLILYNKKNDTTKAGVSTKPSA